jgi:hypothetical protein
MNGNDANQPLDPSDRDLSGEEPSGADPSGQDAHNPETEEDTVSGGAPE